MLKFQLKFALSCSGFFSLCTRPRRCGPTQMGISFTWLSMIQNHHILFSIINTGNTNVLPSRHIYNTTRILWNHIIFPNWWHLTFCLKNAILYILWVSLIANEFSSSLLPVPSVKLIWTSYYTNMLDFNFTGMCKELLVEGSLPYKHMKESIQWKAMGIQERNTAKYSGFSSAWPEGPQFSQHLWEGYFERLCWK